MATTFRVRHARSETAAQWLLEKSPAIASLLLWAHHADGTDEEIARTDGTTIYYGTPFARFTLPEQAFVVAHEVLHVALRHPARAYAMMLRDPGFDREVWNIAADAIINEALITQPYLSMPKAEARGWRLADILATINARRGDKPPLPGPAEWSVEALYRLLSEHPKVGERAGAQGACSCRLVPPAHLDRASEELEARDAARRLRQAIAGDRPRGILRKLLSDIPRTETPWEAVLRRVLTNAAAPRSEDNWARPSRRYLALHGQIPYEPSSRPAPSARIVVVIDTSGSISPELFLRFVGEIVGIQRRTGAHVIVIVADMVVHAIHDLRRQADDLRKISFAGGGGTDFRPAFDAATPYRPAALVYLTDLMGTFPERAPRFPVLWAVPRGTSGAKPPFGSVLHIR